MRFYRSFIVSACMWLMATTTHAQVSYAVSIGQLCPDVELTNVVNYDSPSIRLSQFKGKLLIIDFWASWCSPCVASFSKLDSLQKHFGDKIQILPVTKESAETVLGFFEKMKKIKKLSPMSVTGDKTLYKFFIHRELPHYVWVDTQGYVMAVTDQFELTKENIQAVLDGKKPQLRFKKDTWLNIDQRSRLFKIGIPVKEDDAFIIDSVKQDNVLIHSVITKYLEGVTAGSGHNGSTRFTTRNESVMSLFNYAASGFNYQFINTNRTILEVSDSSRITSNLTTPYEYHLWRKQNTYCYELEVPSSLASKKYEIMLDDLNRFFGPLLGIEGKMEKRKVKCWVLVRTSGIDRLATKGEKPSRQENAFYFSLKNLPLREMMLSLVMFYQQKSPLPLLDETGYTANVDLEINARLSSIPEMNMELEKYDLAFIEAERVIDMVVIKDKK